MHYLTSRSNEPSIKDMGLRLREIDLDLWPKAKDNLVIITHGSVCRLVLDF